MNQYIVLPCCEGGGQRQTWDVCRRDTRVAVSNHDSRRLARKEANERNSEYVSVKKNA